MPIQLATRRTIWPARAAWNLALFAILVVIIALVLTRFALVDFLPGFAAVISSFAVAVLAIPFVLYTWIRVWRTGEQGGRRATFAAVLVFGLLALPLGFAIKGAFLPLLNDVSTDLVNPPSFVALRAERPADANPLDGSTLKPALLQKFYPALRGLLVELPREEATQVVLTLAKERGWRVVADGATDGIVEAVDTSLLLGAKDDIVIRLVERDDGQSLIDMRSASRYGQHDFGANEARVAAFLEDLRLRSLLR